MEPLQKIMVQDELTEENLAKCRNVIYSLIKMESKGDPLPVPMQTTANNKTKTLKKEEQYKVRPNYFNFSFSIWLFILKFMYV